MFIPPGGFALWLYLRFREFTTLIIVEKVQKPSSINLFMIKNDQDSVFLVGSNDGPCCGTLATTHEIEMVPHHLVDQQAIGRKRQLATSVRPTLWTICGIISCAHKSVEDKYLRKKSICQIRNQTYAISSISS